jgi:hypothetical protein
VRQRGGCPAALTPSTSLAWTDGSSAMARAPSAGNACKRYIGDLRTYVDEEIAGWSEEKCLLGHFVLEVHTNLPVFTTGGIETAVRIWQSHFVSCTPVPTCNGNGIRLLSEQFLFL